MNVYVPYVPRRDIYQSLLTITSAMSGNGKVLALDYSHNSLSSNFNGIKIFHYDENQKIFVFHSEIKSI